MSDLPDTSPPGPTADVPSSDDDTGTDALERSAESIREAKEAGGNVAANEDITSLDDRRAGDHSDNPDGGGSLP